MKKRLLCTVTILLISILTILPAFAQGSNVIERHSVEKEVLANILYKPSKDGYTILAQYGEITEDNVRLRKTPSLSGTILRHLHKGYVVSVPYIDQVQADGYTWQYISYQGTGGWVVIDYLYEYN